jgi:hypothetical protein
MRLKSDTVNRTFEKQELEGNVATISIKFRKFPPTINGKPKTKCSAVASMLVRHINVDCTAASIQCI